MFSSLCCCFKSNSSIKFINKQHKDEYKKNKKNMAFIGLILSYINNKHEKLLKGDTFHIFNITYKTINDINDINQYDIYNAIQDYIYLYKNIPDNTTDNLIIPC